MIEKPISHDNKVPKGSSFLAVGPEGGLNNNVLPHLLPEDGLVP